MTTRSKKPAKKPRKPKTLAPQTTTADPESSGHRGPMLLFRQTAGVVVNEDTGLTQTTVWACIRVISESLAGMPWRVGRLTRDGAIDPIDDHPLDWLLNFAPNSETQSFAFRETLWAWALGWGNGYAEIERDFRGEPVALWQLHPSRVTPMRTDDGALIYEVQNDGEPPSYLPPRNIFHLKGPSPDGLVGWSVIRMHARTIGLAIAQENNAASFNANDSTPGGLLKTPNKLSPEAHANLEKSWQKRHGGPNNRRTVAVLEEGLEWEQTGLPPQEAQLVEQMQLTPAMICRIFRVPPHKVADLTRSTNNNIEHQDLEFVKDTLRPWAERGEAEADVKLFGRNNQARLVTVIDLAERERGDTQSQTQHVREMIFTGVYTINMALRYLGHKGIGPEGDKRYMQSAMVPLEDVGKELQQPAPKPEPTDNTLSRVHGRAMAALTDACGRMLRREQKAREQQGELSAEWLAKHSDYCRQSLQSTAGVLAECLNAPPSALDVAITLFVASHLQNGTLNSEETAAKFMEYLTAAASAKAVA
jgi:HK97 family phage portal protein